MAETPSSPLLHNFRHLIGDGPEAALTDRQLLDRFLAYADNTAVEVLVRRYGPLVLGVCRRVLRNAHAAEDSSPTEAAHRSRAVSTNSLKECSSATV